MIKIVQGVYGFLDKSGIVRPKTAADEPFELQPEQEARLVRLGVAEYVGNAEDAQEPENAEQEETEEAQEPIGFDETPPVEVALSEMNVKELREIGKEYGLTFKVGTSKADMVKAIEAVEADLNAEDEDGEPAPVFDASEAVQ